MNAVAGQPIRPLRRKDKADGRSVFILKDPLNLAIEGRDRAQVPLGTLVTLLDPLFLPSALPADVMAIFLSRVSADDLAVRSLWRPPQVMVGPEKRYHLRLRWPYPEVVFALATAD